MDSNSQELQEHGVLNNFTNNLIALGGLTDDPRTVFKFCEPAGTARDLLFKGLLDGTYKKSRNSNTDRCASRSKRLALDG
jgi:hypothetical protein